MRVEMRVVLVIHVDPSTEALHLQAPVPRPGAPRGYPRLVCYLGILCVVLITVGVHKQRTGGFERILREFGLTHPWPLVGAPLHHLQGILRGLPWSPRDYGTPAQAPD